LATPDQNWSDGSSRLDRYGRAISQPCRLEIQSGLGPSLAFSRTLPVLASTPTSLTTFSSLDVLDHQAIISHQPLRRFESVVAAPLKWAQTDLADIFESTFEHIALGIGEHKIAFSERWLAEIPETFTYHAIW
jgi:hypothetical protein